MASAGSHPYGVVIAGLAALEGPKHGGASARVESMLQSMRRARPLRAAVAARVRSGEALDGFGHPLYRDGDPRAGFLLDLLAERYPKSAECRFVGEFAQAASRVTGELPNIDFALAAVARVLDLPPGFAVGSLRDRTKRRLDWTCDQAVHEWTADSSARQVRRRSGGGARVA